MVNDYLVKNGIDASRLTYKGYGHSRPKVSPEKSPADEQMNRRVEILVLDN
jgi:outer membrane protein OmpA-like peptidoglycan-associated protein